MSEFFNLIDINTGVNNSILAQIFENNKNIPLKKKVIEKEFVSRKMFLDIDFPISFKNIEDFIKNTKSIPGDVQRDIRTFHDKNKLYGLIKNGNCKTLTYTWTPLKKSNNETIIRPVARNLYKTQKDREKFISDNNNKCQLCEISGKETRMSIDHWRAHSIYNIDDKKIAILLCEKCNNIHHNNDAVKCILNNKENIKYISNWVKLEKKICELGYFPNKTDKNTQNEIIKQITEYYLDINPSRANFW